MCTAGKKASKNVREIAEALGKPQKEILTVGRPMAAQHVFEQVRVRIDGKITTAYSKLPFLTANRKEIFALARNSAKRKGICHEDKPYD